MSHTGKHAGILGAEMIERPRTLEASPSWIGQVMLALCIAGMMLIACEDAPRRDEDEVHSTSSPDSAQADDMGESDADIDAGQPRLNDCRYEGTQHATARCLEPTREPDYYVDQANAYFDTLDINADRDRVPDYHDQVARWEWPPWLLLTGHTRDEMNSTADVLRRLDPSTIPVRDCRFFETQPFARCYVVFEYEEQPCPIYEEFIFNAEGEMTWIEAWSHQPSLLPQTSEDAWGEDPNYPRLGGRVLGLGKPQGEIDWTSDEAFARAEGDAEVLDFMERALDWRQAWAARLAESPTDFFSTGCGW